MRPSSQQSKKNLTKASDPQELLCESLRVKYEEAQRNHTQLKSKYLHLADALRNGLSIVKAKHIPEFQKHKEPEPVNKKLEKCLDQLEQSVQEKISQAESILTQKPVLEETKKAAPSVTKSHSKDTSTTQTAGKPSSQLSARSKLPTSTSVSSTKSTNTTSVQNYHYKDKKAPAQEISKRNSSLPGKQAGLSTSKLPQPVTVKNDKLSNEVGKAPNLKSQGETGTNSQTATNALQTKQNSQINAGAQQPNQLNERQGANDDQNSSQNLIVFAKFEGALQSKSEGEKSHNLISIYAKLKSNLRSQENELKNSVQYYKANEKKKRNAVISRMQKHSLVMKSTWIAEERNKAKNKSTAKDESEEEIEEKALIRASLRDLRFESEAVALIKPISKIVDLMSRSINSFNTEWIDLNQSKEYYEKLFSSDPELYLKKTFSVWFYLNFLEGGFGMVRKQLENILSEEGYRTGLKAIAKFTDSIMPSSLALPSTETHQVTMKQEFIYSDPSAPTKLYSKKEEFLLPKGCNLKIKLRVQSLLDRWSFVDFRNCLLNLFCSELDALNKEMSYKNSHDAKQALYKLRMIASILNKSKNFPRFCIKSEAVLG